METEKIHLRYGEQSDLIDTVEILYEDIGYPVRFRLLEKGVFS